MPKPHQIQDLTALALEIDSAHVQRDMYMCGTLLMRAKGLLAHGEWIVWLKTNCKIPERTAREYMKLARSPKEYKGRKFSPHNTASKKPTLSSGMIVTVTDKNAPNFGQSVEVVEVEDVIVKCKNSESVTTPYLISELIPPQIKRTNKSKTESKQEPNPVGILSIKLEIAEKRIEILENLLEQFISAAQKNHPPSQDLLKEVESILR